MKYTSNYNLLKPEPAEQFSIDSNNSNMDSLDAELFKKINKENMLMTKSEVLATTGQGYFVDASVINELYTDIISKITPVDFTSQIIFHAARRSTIMEANFYPGLKLVVINFNLVLTTAIENGVATDIFTVPAAYKPKTISYPPLASNQGGVEVQGLISNTGGVFRAYVAGGSTAIVRGTLVYGTDP
ncbi:hypothetical protein [Anaerosacchariphilus polymeriproducens]|uniref:Uncharacterized protein n=1 Tax=Anaerosacchariphilus polymeriproducens TaxID=1812858 RepID=A0A371ARN1_9FIRM|nr:hypothetical protein [Anaerosacchariphilus polymeriproducens]RDU22216.1 hypothetical protein DWV06_16965 [Anaerosacchariphilus polymeriproducens]